MKEYKCKNCGRSFFCDEGAVTAKCIHCGAEQTLPQIHNDTAGRLYCKALYFYEKGDHIRALEIFGRILRNNKNDAEAFWMSALCRYGVHKNKDGYSIMCARPIPFCDSVFYKAALANSNDAQKRIYISEGGKIDECLGEIIMKSRRISPSDIYLCFDGEEENGSETDDFVIAYELYDRLTDLGYDVFMPGVSCVNKTEEERKQYVLSAITTAKLMLVIGSRKEKFNMPRVSDVWNGYASLSDKNNKKTLISVYGNMSEYDLPDALSEYPSYSIAESGAGAVITDAVKKTVLLKRNPDGITSDISMLLERCYYLLENGNKSESEEACRSVLELNSECAEAYLCLLCSKLGVARREELGALCASFNDEKLYLKAIRFADDELKKELRSYCDSVSKNISKKLEQEKNKLSAVKNAEVIKPERAEADAEKNASEMKRRIALRDKINKVSGVLTCGQWNSVGLRTDGTVIAAGYNEFSQCDVEDWFDIKQTACGRFHTVGLRTDGTVVASGKNEYNCCGIAGWQNIASLICNGNNTIGIRTDGTVVAAGENEYDKLEVSDWNNIISVSCGYYCTLGLRSDGTVIATDTLNKYVSGWRDIIAIECGACNAVGIKRDGTVVAAGENIKGQCNVSGWSDIISVSCDFYHTVGLRSDGTVLATGKNKYGQCNVSGWKDIAMIATGGNFTVGLKSDGTVIAVGDNKYGQIDVSGWNNIVYIKCGIYHTLGIKSDGTVVATGYNGKGQCDVSDWKLFGGIDIIEDERREALKLRKRRENGVCQYCGGKFKGVLNKKCSLCGRQKDY